jgi:nucleotide-binding universal stress UspA family protein
MTHVLIAVDDSDSSLVAARTAHRLFGDSAEYTVINVADATPVYWGDDALGSGMVYPLAVPAPGMMGSMPLTVSSPDTSGRGRSEHVVEPAEIAEQTAQQVVAQAGIHDARPVGELGDPAQAIVAAAHDYDADVIVVGAHDRGWLQRLFNSSVADAVVRKADTPVLIAR